MTVDEAHRGEILEQMAQADLAAVEENSVSTQTELDMAVKPDSYSVDVQTEPDNRTQGLHDIGTQAELAQVAPNVEATFTGRVDIENRITRNITRMHWQIFLKHRLEFFSHTIYYYFSYLPYRSVSYPQTS
jgi:hypothetical protein